jgi:hypothetical protein
LPHTISGVRFQNSTHRDSIITGAGAPIPDDSVTMKWEGMQSGDATFLEKKTEYVSRYLCFDNGKAHGLLPRDAFPLYPGS